MSVKRVLINKNKAGFGLSDEAHKMFLNKAGIKYHEYTVNFKTILLKTSPVSYVAALTNSKDDAEKQEVKKTYVHQLSEIPRDHEALWEVADFLGMNHMNDRFSKLEFVDVPTDAEWKIKIIDGIEYISINPNPVPKFEGKCEHWYASDFRPSWMEPKKDIVVLVGTNKNGVVVSHICGWGNIHYNSVDLVDYKWYPLNKLCPVYHAK